MSAIADRVVHEFVAPYTFPNHHRRILEPYNYYDFGQVRLFATANKTLSDSRTCQPLEWLKLAT